MARNVAATEFGAKGDGKTYCTLQLQRAIDKCAETGGGVVTLAPGRYLTGTLRLRSHVELHLERGAVIMGDTRARDKSIYPVRALIYAEDIEDAGISGQGTIDGQANTEAFLSQGFVVNDDVRPNGLHFLRCRDLSFTDFNILNAGSWTFRLQECDGVRIHGINLRSLAQGNNDGIDVDARNVTISDCIIEADDDGICLKSDNPDFMPENITVSNCVIASNCNPIKFGTASYAGFRNVVISNCVIRPTTETNIWHWEEHYDDLPAGVLTGLAGIAIESTDGGIIEHVIIRDITMEGIITPIFIYLGERRGGGKGIVRDIHISDITATAFGNIPCIITGTPRSRIQDVSLRRIRVNHEGGLQPMTERLAENVNGYPENRMFGRLNPAAGLYIRHADHITVEDFEASVRKDDQRPTVVTDDTHDIALLRISQRGIKGTPVQNIESINVSLDAETVLPPHAPNRGLDHLDFFYAGESPRHRMYIVRDGQVVWSYLDPAGQGEISDAILLSDGHILMAHQHGIREVVPTPGTADGYTIRWHMDTPKGYEIHSIQPIGRDKIVYIQCGDPLTCVVREVPSMKVIREFKLPYRDGGSHGQMRNFRLTRKGTLLLASMQYGAIMEFDSYGKELRRIDFPGAWGVEELKNGNILGCSNRGFAREFNKKGDMVWEYDWSKNPDYKDISLQKAHRLPNGNTIINNWFNEWSSQKLDPTHPDVQAIEVTPDGRITWELASWFPPADLGPSTTIQPLDEPIDRMTFHFGDIKP